MNNKKAKIVGSIIGILVFVVIVSGITYAWLTWTSSPIAIEGSSSACFNINYTVSRNIGTSNTTAPLRFQSSYVGSQYAEVILGVDPSCTGMTGTGTIFLTTNSTSGTILNGGLYYTVVSVSGGTETVLSEGAIMQSTEKNLISNINVTTTPNTYRVYLWINGNYADNTYLNATYFGEIGARVSSNG